MNNNRSREVTPIHKRKPIEVYGELVPVLLSLNEVAEMLDMRKQTLRNNLDRQRKGAKVREPLPLPFTIISCGPLWTKKQIEVYLEERNLES
ncbi:hypothetical protein [Desertibacillus haloalkaliphilus]|uniref:hypothetical protein n=1 Tax=Desertibacillus haloalkaliphilus TaxID=1328930 RepID=UPI001C276640|nr:hypothetical protein [Desertibacillus haloalkaliphilus]